MRGLYIHVPFCRAKCGYCGFYSDPSSYDLAELYFDAVIRDLKSRENKNYDTLYIGGGTPSSVPPLVLSAFLERLFNIIGNSFIESTIEANPESITNDFLSVVRDGGFSRLSVGCQSTDDDVLKLLGRIHGRDQIFAAAELVRSVCPDIDLNLDMIFDIPSVESAVTFRTLNDLVSLNPAHISAYSYSFDTGYLSDIDRSEDSDFMQVKRELVIRGYEKYEISNFAVCGHESKHNINYWQLGEYDGLGASAWSLVESGGRRILLGKASDVQSYIKNPESFAEKNVSEDAELIFEDIVFGLRMLDGVDISVLNIKYGQEKIGMLESPLKKLTDEGFLKWKGSRICLTEKGELLLDSVQEFFWSYLP